MTDGESDELHALLSLLTMFRKLSFQDTLGGMELPTITSLLSISTKYDFSEIRADVMKHLVTVFPNELKNRKAARLLRKPTYVIKHLCELVVVALRCDALLILPFVSYILSKLPLQRVIGHLQI